MLLLLVVELLDQLSFLAPYKRIILHQYLWVILGTMLVVFLNLFGFFYAVTRRLFLKDTGRKLAHIDHQLLTPDTIVRDLSERLAQDD